MNAKQRKKWANGKKRLKSKELDRLESYLEDFSRKPRGFVSEKLLEGIKKRRDGLRGGL